MPSHLAVAAWSRPLHREERLVKARRPCRIGTLLSKTGEARGRRVELTRVPEVICLEARQVKNTLAAMRNKTDRNDARGIAQILRTGWYRRVHVKSMHSHRVRALLASRKAILKKCVDLENELRGLLRVFGTRLASRVGHGSFDAEVRDTFAHDEMLSSALTPLLEVIFCCFSDKDLAVYEALM
ncbi:MAG: transposase [Variovorax sp.]|nr:MAG: transposase [Variovorax sp.]